MSRIDDTTWAFVARALDQMARIDHQNEHIIDTLRLTPESPIYQGHCQICEMAIDALEKLIGDEFQNLSWWAWENCWGAQGHTAGCPDGETRVIDTLDNLRWLIELECGAGKYE